MTDFIRLSVAGSAQRVEVVVPTDEVVADLVRQLRELLSEPVPAAQRLGLVRRDGRALEPGDTLAGQRVDHGSELVLVPVEDVPPPPEVADVTDVLSDTWATRRRQVVAVGTVGSLVAVGLLTAGAGWVVTGSEPTPGPGWLVAAAVVAALAVAAARVRRSRVRPGLAAAALGLSAPLVLAAVAVGGTEVAAGTGGAALVAVALLPRLALSGSGLTTVDDEVVAGRPRPREFVLRRADAAYDLLTWTMLAVVVTLAASLVVLTRSADRWALGLGAALLLATALRARAVPLPSHQAALGLAAVLGLLAAIGPGSTLHVLDPAVAVGVLVTVAATLVASSVGLPARRAARLRRTAGRIEAVVLAAVLPLALGTFGIYSDLLGAFR